MQSFTRIPAIRNQIWLLQPTEISLQIYIHLLRNLSCVRSCFPSQASSPDGAIQFFLLQVPLPCVYIKIIQ
jgi:hypothetical protein